MRLFRFVCLCVGVLALVGCGVSDSSAVLESEHTSVDGFSEIQDADTGMYLRWKFDVSTVTFEVSGQTEGWVGVGWARITQSSVKMANCDIVMGSMDDYDLTISDGFGASSKTVVADLLAEGSSDLSAVTGNEVAGWTTIRFTVPLDSGDARDTVFQKGETYKIILAKSSADNLTTGHGASSSSRSTFKLKL